MKFLVLKSNDPYFNLAVEEYLFLNENDDVFMLWQNAPTVVVGKNQNAYAEIKMDVIREKEIKISRRITGGGAVYHDLGNVNYSFISTRSEFSDIDFKYFTAPIIEALASMGVNAELSGRNDLLADGRKFSGNAQYTKGKRTLHHGTLLFNSDLTMLSQVLNVDRTKIASKAIASVRSRVINLSEIISSDMSVDEFIATLSAFIIKKYSPEIIDVSTCEEIEKLTKRNSSEEWLFPHKKLIAEYGVHKKRRFDFGIVELYLDMSNEVIKNAKIYGDFFGVGDIAELEHIIVGANLSQISDRLTKVDVSEYIFGMSAAELEALILDK